MRQRKLRAFTLLSLLAIIASVLLWPNVAWAHPLGNFTINTLSLVEVSGELVKVRFVGDFAEIPAFQEMREIDSDHDGRVSDEEREAYMGRKAEEIKNGLRLAIDGSPTTLKVKAKELEFRPGEADLSTMRFVVDFLGVVPPSSRPEPQTLYFQNDNFVERLGLKEIVVSAGNGATLFSSDASVVDLTNNLRVYPERLRSNPPSRKQASATFITTGVAETVETFSESAGREFVPGATGGPLTALLPAEKLSLLIVVAAVAIAVGLGALHAASPGHGKTIMAAYLVGTRGTALQAILLGITVAISHTLGVLGLGLVVLFASNLVSPDSLFPWLSLTSGGVIIVIGSWLLVSKLREGRHGLQAHEHTHNRAENTGTQSGGLIGRISRTGARLSHGNAHDAAKSHAHGPVPRQEGSRMRTTWQSLAALGIVGGLVPSASALIILLASISLQRIGFGLVLIIAFSVGMAAVLTGIGLLLVYAGRVMERLQERSGALRIATRILPHVTAMVVLVSGLFVALKAALEVGLL